MRPMMRFRTDGARLSVSLSGQGSGGGLKITAVLQEGVGRKFGIASFGLEDGRSAEDVEEVRALPVGGGGHSNFLPRTPPVAYLSPLMDFDPTMREQHVF